MALKDNIDTLKNELTTQGQFLESMIKSERFFKKHRKKLIILAVVIVLAILYYFVSGSIKQNNLIKSNEAYAVLQINPDDAKMLEELKSKNKPLFRLYTFQEAVKNNNTEVLNFLVAENSSDLIGQLASYQLGENANVTVLDNYIKVQEAYELLKDGKTQEANLILQTIPADSQLLNIINALTHYQPESK